MGVLNPPPHADAGLETHPLRNESMELEEDLDHPSTNGMEQWTACFLSGRVLRMVANGATLSYEFSARGGTRSDAVGTPFL